MPSIPFVYHSFPLNIHFDSVKVGFESEHTFLYNFRPASNTNIDVDKIFHITLILSLTVGFDIVTVASILDTYFHVVFLEIFNNDSLISHI